MVWVCADADDGSGDDVSDDMNDASDEGGNDGSDDDGSHTATHTTEAPTSTSITIMCLCVCVYLCLGQVRVAQLRRRVAADRSISQYALEGISSWVLAVVIHLCRRSVCSSGHIAHRSLCGPAAAAV